MKFGCDKDFCFNKFCAKNKFIDHGTDRELGLKALKIMQEDHENILCGDSVTFSRKHLKDLTQDKLIRLTEDVETFCSSFSVHNFASIGDSAPENPFKLMHIDFQAV